MKTTKRTTNTRTPRRPGSKMAGAWKIAYKVLDCRLRSPIAPRDAAVKYKPGKITRPRKGAGPLTLFRTATTALNFGLARGWSIWRAEYLPANDEQLDDEVLWTPNGCDYVLRRELPPGTILAEAVRLREKLIEHVGTNLVTYTARSPKEKPKRKR